jgi:ubiquinone/menaquinone biosynthesis C-methylase UbiE
MTKTTVDFSVTSPYSQNLERSKAQIFIDQASYRHQIQFIAKAAKAEEAGLLDVGCGSGIFLNVVSDLLANVSLHGLDYDHRLLDEASLRVNKASFVRASAEELPFEDSTFDFITTFHNIEHLYHPEYFIAECARVLKNGGYVLLATPNPSSYVAKMLKENWPADPSNTPDHIALKAPEVWKSMFEEHSFKVVKEGTTFGSSLPLIRRTPLKFLNHFMLYTFGTASWSKGEAYQAIFQIKK